MLTSASVHDSQVAMRFKTQSGLGGRVAPHINIAHGAGVEASRLVSSDTHCADYFLVFTTDQHSARLEISEKCFKSRANVLGVPPALPGWQ